MRCTADARAIRFFCPHACVGRPQSLARPPGRPLPQLRTVGVCHKVNCVPPLMSHALDILFDLFGVLLARSECGVVGYGGGWIRSPVVGLGGFSDQASATGKQRHLPCFAPMVLGQPSSWLICSPLLIALNLSHRRHTLVTIQSQPCPCPVLLYFCCTCHCFSLRHVCPRLFVEYACVQPTPHTNERPHPPSDPSPHIRDTATRRWSYRDQRPKDVTFVSLTTLDLL